MRLDAAPPLRERNLVVGRDVLLAAHADDQVLEQRRVQRVERRLVDVGGQVDAGDDRAQRPGLTRNLQHDGSVPLRRPGLRPRLRCTFS